MDKMPQENFSARPSIISSCWKQRDRSTVLLVPLQWRTTSKSQKAIPLQLQLPIQINSKVNFDSKVDDDVEIEIVDIPLADELGSHTIGRTNESEGKHQEKIKINGGEGIHTSQTDEKTGWNGSHDNSMSSKYPPNGTASANWTPMKTRPKLLQMETVEAERSSSVLHGGVKKNSGAASGERKILPYHSNRSASRGERPNQKNEEQAKNSADIAATVNTSEASRKGSTRPTSHLQPAISKTLLMLNTNINPARIMAPQPSEMW